MAELIKMPKMSDTMTEGVIAAWLKKVGDKVKSGDVLAEVETDKATMELENYEDGTLLYVGPKEGEAVVVNGLLAIVGKEGEDIAALLKDAQAETAQLAAGETAEAPAAEAPAPAEVPKAAPAAAAPAPAAPKAEPAKPAAPAGNGKKATVIRMPKMSDTMTEGTIAAWLKKVGDKVKSGDILAEVETDKATMELDNYEDGTLLYIGPKEGEAVPVDGVLAIIGEEGADVQALLGGQDAAAGASAADEAATERSETENAERPAEIQAEAKATGQTSASTSQAAPAANGGRIFASPLAKSIAKDKGIDLHTIKGSGENGRIVSRDLEAVSASAVPAPAAAPAVSAPAAQPAAAPLRWLPSRLRPLHLLPSPPSPPMAPTPTRRCRRCAKLLPVASPKACSRPRISI